MTDSGVVLREVDDGDASILFEQQRDPESIRMAAFTSKDPDDRAAFDAHFAKKMSDPSIRLLTIVHEGSVVGSIAAFDSEGLREVTYGIGREFWGRGLATAALRAFLEVEVSRPMHARAASDNRGSTRVLGKCGFALVEEGRWFSNARGMEIDEVLMRLD